MGRGHGILEEAVGFGVARDPGVGVDVDHAGEHQHAGRIDHPLGGRGRTRERRLDRGDDAAVGREIGAARPVDRDDRAAGDDEVGQSSTSRMRIDCAPSHSARRPTSRKRSAQPSSGTTDAKWFAAS